MSSPEPFEVTESFATLSIVTTDARPEAFRDLEEQVTPRQTRFPILPQPIEASSQRKRPCSRQNSQSVSDTEEEDTAKMPSGSSSSKHHSSSSSSKKHSSSSSSKYRSKSDDWSEVTEPEERRRIQNRIAQRKFREKAREQKERQERDNRNQELASSSYSIPVPSDFMSGSDAGGDDLSGVPWGGLNIQHMVARGHKSASQQGGSQPAQLYGGGGGEQQYYDYDYDNSAQYGTGYAGTGSSYGYGGGGSVGSSSYEAAGAGNSGVDDRGGQWQQQQPGGEVLAEEEEEHDGDIDPALYEVDDHHDKGKGNAY